MVAIFGSEAGVWSLFTFIRGEREERSARGVSSGW
jgi:hypothetical protein